VHCKKVAQRWYLSEQISPVSAIALLRRISIICLILLQFYPWPPVGTKLEMRCSMRAVTADGAAGRTYRPG
jgi:hypothetical protein